MGTKKKTNKQLNIAPQRLAGSAVDCPGSFQKSFRFVSFVSECVFACVCVFSFDSTSLSHAGQASTSPAGTVTCHTIKWLAVSCNSSGSNRHTHKKQSGSVVVGFAVPRNRV